MTKPFEPDGKTTPQRQARSGDAVVLSEKLEAADFKRALDVGNVVKSIVELTRESHRRSKQVVEELSAFQG